MEPAPSNWFFRFLHRLGDHELGVLLAFAGIVSTIWLFAFIAAEMKEGDTTAFDKQILLAMRHKSDLSPLGSPGFQEAARDVTALGGPTVLVLLTLFSGGYLFLSGKRHMGLFVYGAVAGGLLLSTILKDSFHRARPDIVPHEAYFSTSSFPSGHSMMSASTYLTLAALLALSQQRKRLKAYFLLTGGFITFLVGLSRVYLGVHWPTDVLAGWTAGACWAIVCWLIARRLQRSHAIEPEADLPSL
jgi:undecaprenyl-diphosphatase